eukprot:scaffold122541_cov20-Tisochrysis_lutea.AAC.1
MRKFKACAAWNGSWSMTGHSSEGRHQDTTRGGGTINVGGMRLLKYGTAQNSRIFQCATLGCHLQGKVLYLGVSLLFLDYSAQNVMPNGAVMSALEDGE